MLIKLPKVCTNCETKYIVVYDNEVYDTKPMVCPFCSYELDEEESVKENDNWD
jgi:hypothetical protein